MSSAKIEKIEELRKKYPNIGPRYSARESKFADKLKIIIIDQEENTMKKILILAGAGTKTDCEFSAGG